MWARALLEVRCIGEGTTVAHVIRSFGADLWEIEDNKWSNETVLQRCGQGDASTGVQQYPRVGSASSEQTCRLVKRARSSTGSRLIDSDAGATVTVNRKLADCFVGDPSSCIHYFRTLVAPTTSPTPSPNCRHYIPHPAPLPDSEVTPYLHQHGLPERNIHLQTRAPLHKSTCHIRTLRFCLRGLARLLPAKLCTGNEAGLVGAGGGGSGGDDMVVAVVGCSLVGCSAWWW